jgi:hypothetical protein
LKRDTSGNLCASSYSECRDTTDCYLNRRLTESGAVFSEEFSRVPRKAARAGHRPLEKYEDSGILAFNSIVAGRGDCYSKLNAELLAKHVQFYFDPSMFARRPPSRMAERISVGPSVDEDQAFRARGYV